MLKTNRENPGGSRFSGRSDFAPAPYAPNNSQYNPVTSPNASSSKYQAEGADPDTANVMGALTDNASPPPAGGLSQIHSMGMPPGDNSGQLADAKLMSNAVHNGTYDQLMSSFNPPLAAPAPTAGLGSIGGMRPATNAKFML